MSVFFKKLSILVPLLAVVLSAPAAMAECKGKSSTSCGVDSKCTWVDGYKRSDGAKVKSYCRAVSGKKSVKANTKKATSNSTKSKPVDKKKTSSKLKEEKSKVTKKVKKTDSKKSIKDKKTIKKKVEKKAVKKAVE